MEFFLTLLGLILIIEGLPYAASPEAMQRWLAQVQELPPSTLRGFGLVAVGLGLFLCYLTQRSGFFA